MTVTETKSGSMFDGMNEKALITLADERYGLKIDPSVPKKAIIAELVRQEENRIGAARTMNEKSAMLVANENDPLIKIMFNRFDFTYADLKFCYDSGRGYVNKKPKAGQKSVAKQVEAGKLKSPPWYHLFPGNEYKLPLSVVRHLESLIYTENQPVIDPVTGMISGGRAITKPRFSVNIVMDDDQLKQIGKTSL